VDLKLKNMKKIFLTFATAVLFSVSVFAADGGKKPTDGSANVSYAAQQEFTTDFATAQNVIWTVNKNCQKADFEIDGVKKTAFYNFSGDFIGTTQAVDYKVIPAKMQKQIAADFKGFTAVEVIKFEANTTYNADVEPTTYFVDLKSTSEELLVKVTASGNVEFFKQVK
jgi:hypothetical protein